MPQEIFFFQGMPQELNPNCIQSSEYQTINPSKKSKPTIPTTKNPTTSTGSVRISPTILQKYISTKKENDQDRISDMILMAYVPTLFS